MINFTKEVFPNGLTLIINPIEDTRLVAFNILYRVGSRNENPALTGIAHLMEHLMFAGTKKFPRYDLPIATAGGYNNAFTNPDFTNYYIVVPAEGLETAFSLEADRMFNLQVTEKAFTVQQRVVIEEYRQRYLNQPFGDLHHLIMKLAYKVHPYRWPTIGMDISHIEKITLSNINDFYRWFYTPSNAILTISGNVDVQTAKMLTNKYFSSNGLINPTESLTKEPIQRKPRKKTVYRDVPASIITIAWPMMAQNHPGYYTCDLLSDIMGTGPSSRLYKTLVTQKGIFTDIAAYISGSADPGLLMIKGLLAQTTPMEEAEEAIHATINDLLVNGINEKELITVKNKAKTNLLLSMQKPEHLSVMISSFEFNQDVNIINRLLNMYDDVSTLDIHNMAKKILTSNRTNTLCYSTKNK
ncbi:MAG: pitrilysin family protein [Bacteroidales bacterium]|nr:pitrilysin family protein [Bacteroidales bacterium]